MLENQHKKKTNRVAETILGVLGSIFGLLGGLFAIVIGSIGTEFDSQDTGMVSSLGIATIIVCIITLIVSCIINKHRIVMGTLLVIGGILNFIFIGFFGIFSGILILVAGIITLIRK